MFRPARMLARRCLAQDGFTLVELMASVLVLTVGVMGLFASMDSQRDLVNVSERKETVAHIAEREMERLLALPYSRLAMPTGTTLVRSTDPNNPNNYVTASGTFQWDRNNSSRVSPIVTDAAGEVTHGPESWTSSPADGGRLTGTIRRYVTRVDDPACRPVGSCANGAYRRVTVAVTVNGTDGPRRPTLISSLVSNPDDGPESTTDGPFTECLNDEGELEVCKGTPDPPNFFYLHDTPASQSSRQPIAGDHPLHRTVATGGCGANGCPDLMSATPPPSATPEPPLHNYSSDVAGAYPGGRALRGDTSCNGTPTSTDHTKGHFWVSGPLSQAKTLTGQGGLTLYSQNLGAASGAQTLCVAFYDVAGNMSGTPTELGRSTFQQNRWPIGMVAPVSFRLDFRGSSSNVTVASGRRIGMRLWVAPGSADVALAYDHPAYDSVLQLNEEGG